MDELIDRHYRAEERSDPDGAVADFTKEILHEVAGTHRLYGRDAARIFYVDLFATLRLTRITSERRLYGRSFAIDEARVEAVTQDGEPTVFRLLHVFEFANGRISRESAWQAPLYEGPALTER